MTFQVAIFELLRLHHLKFQISTAQVKYFYKQTFEDIFKFQNF